MTTWRGGTAGVGRHAGVRQDACPDDANPDGAGLDGRGAAAGGAEEAQYLDACVADVQAWLGPELTAYLAGAESPKELTRWSSGSTGVRASAAGRRLQAASEVVEAFTAAGQGTMAQAWLREVSPLTAGRSPAYLVRHATNERVLGQIVQAAERYVKPSGKPSAPAA